MFTIHKMQSLMCAHDAVAQKDFSPHLPELPVEMDEDEETIKIVQLVKSNEPLVSFTSCDYCFLRKLLQIIMEAYYASMIPVCTLYSWLGFCVCMTKLLDMERVC
jgi:hypothetical protein